MKWVLFGILGLAACYVVVFAVVLMAMLQPPERFGLFMKHVPTGAGVARTARLPHVALGTKGRLAPRFPGAGLRITEAR